MSRSATAAGQDVEPARPSSSNGDSDGAAAEPSRSRRKIAQQAQELIARADAPGRSPRTAWTFLTNHGHVLIYIARNPEARVRDIAADIGITERSAHSILRDLARAGYITPDKVGRRNTYTLHSELAFRHPAEADRSVGELLQIFTTTSRRRRTARPG